MEGETSASRVPRLSAQLRSTTVSDLVVRACKHFAHCQRRRLGLALEIDQSRVGGAGETVMPMPNQHAADRGETSHA